jgi:hypothetical protein
VGEVPKSHQGEPQPLSFEEVKAAKDVFINAIWTSHRDSGISGASVVGRAETGGFLVKINVKEESDVEGAERLADTYLSNVPRKIEVEGRITAAGAETEA